MIELPKGWEIKRLADCLEKLKSGKLAERGWSPQCLNYPVQSKGAWGVLKTTSVQMGEYQPEHNKELPDSLDPKIGFEVNPGDFLVTTTGPRNRCGIVCNVKRTPKKLIFSGKILRFRANQEIISANWLMFLLMSPEYQKTLDKLKVGTSDSSVSIGNKQILDLEIPVPPIAEQQEIVALLEDHLSRLDAALTDVKLAKLKAVQFRRALLQDIFIGNLSKNEIHGKIDWPILKLEEICSFITDGSHNPPKGVDSSGFLMLSSRDIQNGKLTFEKPRYLSEEDFIMENKRTDLQLDDVLLTTVGTIGRTAIYGGKPKNVTFQRSVSILRPNKQKVSSKFLMYFLDSITELLNQEARGVAQQGIYLNQVRKLDIPVPSSSEQLKIVGVLDNHLSRLDASLALADAMEKQSSALRRSLLHAATTGQLSREVTSV